jgi:hypothetical protein
VSRLSWLPDDRRVSHLDERYPEGSRPALAKTHPDRAERLRLEAEAAEEVAEGCDDPAQAAQWLAYARGIQHALRVLDPKGAG